MLGLADAASGARITTSRMKLKPGLPWAGISRLLMNKTKLAR
jgi:hypothetical protein